MPPPPRTPVLTPAPAAAAPGEVVATAQMSSPTAGARPVPPPPPPSTPADGVGATRAQIASMEQVPARGARPRKRKARKKGTSPLLLLFLGLLVGSAAAVVGVLAWTALSGGEEEAPKPLVEDLVVPLPPPVAAPSRDRTPQRSATRPEPRVERSEPAPTPLAAAPTPEPVVEPEPATTPLAVAAPQPSSAESERERQRAERAARDEERRLRREAQAQQAAERERAAQAAAARAAREAAVPDPMATPKPSVPSPNAGNHFRISAGSATPSKDDDGEITVRFAATLHGEGIEEVIAHFNPRGASWIKKPMKSKDGSHYVVNVGFKERNHGLFYYYFTARDADGVEVELGDDDEPREAVAE